MAPGVGAYHVSLLARCGAGWAADNMWLQGVAIALPHVQRTWRMSDAWVGSLTSSLFAGMMLGAIAWGAYADRHGRLFAYHRTLVVAAVGGSLLSLAPTWVAACVLAGLLGIGIGGSMPIDGTLFIESLPPRHHYWLTALSVFFSLGSVVSALAALALLAGTGASWRILLLTLAGLTAMAAAARLGRFRTYESPAFLVACGREAEADLVLQAMAPDHGTLEDALMEDAEQGRNDSGALFARGQARTTILLWLLWTLQSLAFTLFNALYPLYLERKGGATAPRPQAAVLRDVLAYAVSSVPGSLIGAALVRSAYGRYALAMTLSATGLALLMFLWATRTWHVVAAGMAVSLCATTAYAVLYGQTPRAFPTRVRGTGCAIASAASRAAGIVAPMLGGKAPSE
ncbi:hypothetical protein MCAP1_000127 [Malassezia caprae]|uniref:Major facilitator superfamily (MFS) profile domain-containing protein n=1 Tax=Malassezia caprae TaxID=1381934 RepID=A0AAF0ITP2_9BASI|nr:hypothetical protein MCAP1_000127 [Malassezia caprae]